MEQAMVKKSIFRQKTYVKKYGASRYESISYNSIHSYSLWDGIGKEIADDEIAVCEISMPMLQKDEDFFLIEQNLKVKISSIMRASDDSVVYYIQGKLIDTEESLKEKEEVQAFFNNQEAIKKLDTIKASIKSFNYQIEKIPAKILKKYSLSPITMDEK